MTRLEALEYYRTATEVADIRALLSGDLFYLLVFGLNRPDMNKDWLYARCREVQASPNGHLDLWAREHYKSTIITFGLTILDVLRNPNVTIGIFSHSRPVAKSFLGQIKREFENNALLQEYFPHICKPARQESRSWSDEKLIVKRDANPKEATIEAWGLVDGQPIGKHFEILVYDDVVTRESVNTAEQIKKTTDAWRLSLNLGAHGGVMRMIGTRYHLLDTYHELLKQGSVVPRLHPATDNGQESGKPVFLDQKALATKRRDMGLYVFACQMLQNPSADNMQSFREEWVQYWQPSPEHYMAMTRVILVDPANAKKQTSDYTVMWVIGRNHDGKWYVIHFLRDRMSLTERTQKLFDLVRAYQVQSVGYEQYGMQADIEHIKTEQARQCYRFAITPLGGNMPKVDRIKRLVPLFENGDILLPSVCTHRMGDGTIVNMTKELLDSEYLLFPMCGHDDMMDSLARIFDISVGIPNVGGHKPKAKAKTGFSVWKK